jgi:23S rRNA pseudouridine2457 synthase
MYQYFLLYKPYLMLSQFTRETPGQQTLADLDYTFPKDVYPVGRLDADSEGLLLLTNDKSLNARMLDPVAAHPRTYWVQVEGIPSFSALEQLRQGVSIRINGRNFTTRPSKVRLLDAPPELPDRDPPVRFRQSIPDQWLEITVTEGKNRQVRRMCAAVGYPVLRLVRIGIGLLRLSDPELVRLVPGLVMEISGNVLEQLTGRFK